MNPLKIFNSLKSKPLGKWIFSKAVCFQAPFFSSIKPTIQNLEKNMCVVTMNKRRSVLNHFGTVHAIAMCNMAELAAGMMTDVSIPKSSRWIPTGMSVNYLKKAKSHLIATADGNNIDWENEDSAIVPVSIKDQLGVEVFNANIYMNLKHS